MTPGSFTFMLTVPCDPALAEVVTGVAAHAVSYAAMDQAAGAEFVKRVAAATTAELNVVGSGKNSGAVCPIVVTSADGELRITIGDHTISQKLSA